MTVPVRDRSSATTVRPKVHGRAPATIPSRSNAPAKSTKKTAAQRAYAKRSQRASTGTAAEVVKRGSFKARIPFVASIIGLLSVGLAVTLLLTTRAAEDSYKLSAAKAHNQSLIEQRAALERDYQVATSAPELARKAADLGMIPAKDVARLVVDDHGGVQVVGKPTPAQGAPVPPLNKQPGNTAANTGLQVANPAAAAQTPRGAAPTAVATRPGTPLAANQPQLLPQGEQLVPMNQARTTSGQAGSAGGQR
ncbi:hypothetical protein [Rhodococcus spelaei]|uniref:hypothetical protein n=1 Tax=Rhodococcus spelaei TaxID=2546320 RepID=UPI001FEC2703|nr:hypothetical protein [Rhodococcus spelaei]